MITYEVSEKAEYFLFFSGQKELENFRSRKDHVQFKELSSMDITLFTVKTKRTSFFWDYILSMSFPKEFLNTQKAIELKEYLNKNGITYSISKAYQADSHTEGKSFLLSMYNWKPNEPKSRFDSMMDHFDLEMKTDWFLKFGFYESIAHTSGLDFIFIGVTHDVDHLEEIFNDPLLETMRTSAERFLLDETRVTALLSAERMENI